jgi:DNA repair exonuclease SbcCD ATPase subunit
MIPENLHMQNFFSHKDSEIDFSEFSSALLIGNTEGDYSKSNGSGKSSIFEAILWCLFNKSRQGMMDDVVSWGETTCSVSLEFTHSEILYRVVRTRNRMNSTSAVSFSYMDKAGDWNDISCSTSGDTNAKIESVIKLEYKTFINSVYFRQNDISEFAEADPSRKKEILKSIIDISRWDSYEKEAKKKSKKVSEECKALSKSIENYDDEFLKLLESRESIVEVRVELESLVKKKSEERSSVESYSKRYSELKNSLDTDTYDAVIGDLSSLKVSEKRITEELSLETARFDKSSDNLLSLNIKIGKIERYIEANPFTKVEDGELADLRYQLSHYKAEKASCEEFVKSLDELDISADECYVCGQSVGESLHAKLISDIDQKKRVYVDKRLVAINEIIDIDSRLNLLIKSTETNRKIEVAKEKLASTNSSRSILSDSVDNLGGRVSALSSELEDVNKKIIDSNKILDSIKNEDFQKIRKIIASIKTSLKETDISISEKNVELGALLERESLLDIRVSKMLSDKKKIAKRMEKASLYLRMSKLFGKNGIQSILLDAIIEDLEITSNTILSSICNEPSTIILETQRIGADGSSLIETLDLKVRKDGNLQNFKALSGGEQFRISLALRIALSDISSRYGGSSLEFLLLDEVNSPLDRYGVETLFVNVIKSLEDKYKIMVITHDESLKEKFANIIDSTKVNGETEIVFTRR